MTDQEALRRQLNAMVEKAHRTLKVAQEHLERDQSEFASSKAYYAVFHMMQAILLTRGLTYSKHAGVVSGFSQHFLKCGVFPKEFGEMIQRLRKDRELSDYGYQLSVEPNSATEDVCAAAQIVDQLNTYLTPFLA
ncbi:MAG: HEPN domain-containing protein [Candidatus Omnitrophica bacterium]|nr:HEPN domain-containing protein [Candidatus Omnitrophota bacterium]